MVKVGFIVEGGSEKIIVESEAFKSMLNDNDFELVTPVIDAKGGGNLLPQNIDVFVERLLAKDVEQILVLTDLEDESSTEVVRQRIQHEKVTFTFIAVKALEAWYLADSDAMKRWLKVDEFNEPAPEQTPGKPWERLKQIAQTLEKPGPGSNKIAFAKRMVKYWKFDIQNAGRHPDCASAAELVTYFSSET